MRNGQRVIVEYLFAIRILLGLDRLLIVHDGHAAAALGLKVAVLHLRIDEEVVERVSLHHRLQLALAAPLDRIGRVGNKQLCVQMNSIGRVVAYGECVCELVEWVG
jgi:hypothetical protein